MTNGYLTYLLIASLTIASPGPGIVMSITNSIKYGLSGAVPSIFGVVLGMFIVALISATSVGGLLASSVIAFSIAKLIGALYLVYLGFKLLRSTSIKSRNDVEMRPNYLPPTGRFKEGLLLTLSNPKPIVFFIALFPQFIDIATPYAIQFLILSITFCLLVLLIHTVYAVFAQSIKLKIMSAGGLVIINRVGGACFLVFARVIFCTTKFS